jgi:hypothetical protein
VGGTAPGASRASGHGSGRQQLLALPGPVAQAQLGHGPAAHVSAWSLFTPLLVVVLGIGAGLSAVALMRRAR